MKQGETPISWPFQAVVGAPETWILDLLGFSKARIYYASRFAQRAGLPSKSALRRVGCKGAERLVTWILSPKYFAPGLADSSPFRSGFEAK